MHDVAEDSLEAFEWSLVDIEKWNNLEEDYFGEWLDLQKITYLCPSQK